MVCFVTRNKSFVQSIHIPFPLVTLHDGFTFVDRRGDAPIFLHSFPDWSDKERHVRTEASSSGSPFTVTCAS